MFSVKYFRNVARSVSQMSYEVVVQETQSSKFAVINGQFVRVPAKPVPTKTEEITHTGQFFDENDWRRNRWHDRQKLVNRNWGVRLVAEVPPTEVDGRVAVCDGRDGPDAPAALGHPRVYINLDKGEVENCGYCGMRFVQKHHH